MSENKNVLNVDTKKSDLSPDDKHMLKSMFWRSWLLFSSFTMVKMQAFGFEFSMFPVINRFYKNNSNEKKQAIVRELAVIAPIIIIPMTVAKSVIFPIKPDLEDFSINFSPEV